MLNTELIQFQSTLPREERQVVTDILSSCSRFQSTLPREERQIYENDVLFYLNISIHAPTRGATLSLFCRCATLDNFNPRSHERSDEKGLKIAYKGFYFNPRSHERSDFFPLALPFKVCISIHAPTRGATAILHKKFVYFYTIPTINI